jgi:hypothetical protein
VAGEISELYRVAGVMNYINPKTGKPWDMWPCGCRTEPPPRKPGVKTSLTPETAAAWRAESAHYRAAGQNSREGQLAEATPTGSTGV